MNIISARDTTKLFQLGSIGDARLGSAGGWLQDSFPRYELRRCYCEPMLKQNWLLSRRSGEFVLLLAGKLRDEDIEHVVTVDADRRLIVDSCEE